MTKIIVAPGSFKHSLTATQVAESILNGLQHSMLHAEYYLLPIADGGNGTLDAFLAKSGSRHKTNVEDPFGHTIEAEFGLIDNGMTAIIEMALASGIELIDDGDPMKASTYGTGQLLQAALDAGAKKFVVGMGGSATVDGGAGCLQALGIRLLKSDGTEISRGAAELEQIAEIDIGRLDKKWYDTEIIIACDVDNPLLGETGAANIFGPQKGAKPEDIEKLENGLSHFYALVNEKFNIDVRNAQGAGAAGGLSAALMAFLRGHLESGIDLILKHNEFQSLVTEADLVITGEGAIDSQTIHGKGPIGIARIAHEHNVPTIAIVGGLNADDRLLHDAGIHAVLPIVTGPMTLASAIEQAKELVERTATRLGYLLQLDIG